MNNYINAGRVSMIYKGQWDQNSVKETYNILDVVSYNGSVYCLYKTYTQQETYSNPKVDINNWYKLSGSIVTSAQATSLPATAQPTVQVSTNSDGDQQLTFGIPKGITNNDLSAQDSSLQISYNDTTNITDISHTTLIQNPPQVENNALYPINFNSKGHIISYDNAVDVIVNPQNKQTNDFLKWNGSSWIGSQLSGAVTSVNNKSGDVILNYNDVGASSSSHAEQHAINGNDTIAPSDIGAASAIHASQHAINGSDAITPSSIGAIENPNVKANGQYLKYTENQWIADNAPVISVNNTTGEVITSKAFTLTVSSTGWGQIGNIYTKTLTDSYDANIAYITSNSKIIVSPSSSDYDDCINIRLRCHSLGNHSITFAASTPPNQNLNVNILIIY